VAAAFIVVVGGWAWAFGPSFLSLASHPVDPSIAGIIQGASQVQAQASAYTDSSDLKKQLDAASAELNSLSEEASAKQAILDSIVSHDASSTAPTHALFQPSTTAPVTKPANP